MSPGGPGPLNPRNLPLALVNLELKVRTEVRKPLGAKHMGM